MKLRHVQPTVLMVSLVVAAMTVIGCGQSGTTSRPSQKSNSAAASDHGGWWCTEHGLPEEECSICSSKAAAKFKAKGDWCGEHNRAESQCFLCDPKRAEKFVALYEAKFGKKPPVPKE